MVLNPDKKIEDTYDFIKKLGNITTAEINVSLRGGGGESKIEAHILRVKAKPLYDNEGNITGAIESIHNLTKHKKVEKDLKTSERILRGVVEHATDGIVICDEQGTITCWNHALEIITEIERSEAIGQPIWEMIFKRINPKERQSHKTLKIIKRSFLELLKSGVVTDRLKKAKHKITLPNGEQKFLSVGASAIKTEKGFLISSIITDITEQKMAEDKIRKSFREKNLLIKEIHHRVKNNLQIIYSLHDLQKQFVKDHPISINILKESQNRILSMALIHDMLYQSEDFSHINLSDYITNLVNKIFHSYRAHNKITPILDLENIHLNIETSVPLGLIISELVSNSLKHAFPDRNGEISISLKSYDKKYQLTTSDDGIGMPKNITLGDSKVGLGLSLVNSLVQQLDGSINLDRSQGTKYIIKFKELEYQKRF